MNFGYFEKKRSLVIRSVAFLGLVAIFAFSVEAQKRPSRSSGQTTIGIASPDEVLTPAASNAMQCQNGKASSPNACSNSAYSTGALNKNNSHYVEGDSIPYQVTVSAPANSTGNTITLNYDTSKGGIHAFDYLTAYDRTETVASGNDPCTGTGADCALKTTFTIPDDPNIANDPSGRLLTMFGGTITNVSAFTLSGSFAGDSSESVTITFSMGPNASTGIIAVGGHLSTRKDWGNGKASPNISGSPFHFDSGGNQLQVQIGALTAAATINIVKLVHNLSGTNLNPTAHFGFISNGGPLGNFSLTDTDPSATVGGVMTATTGNVGTSFTVSEDLANMPLGYTFTQGSCVIDPAGFANTSTATANIGVNTVATIVPGEGNTITCTYQNGGGFTTAAKVTIGGRIADSSGRGISGARVTIIDDHGQSRIATTNTFGYYSFDEIEVGRAYVVGVSARRYTFTSRLLALTDALSNIDFVAN
jgi:hypothetical protein